MTLGALELGTLLSGAVLTEQVFIIPGFGKLIVDAVFNRDYAVVQGVVLVTATVYIMLNLLADMPYVLVNPRLRAHDARRRTLAAGVTRGAPARRSARPGAAARCAGCCGRTRRGGRPGRDRCLRAGRGVRAADRALRPDRHQLGRCAQGAVARCTGSAPTRSAATCSRA